jgi:hypothetical protein
MHKEAPADLSRDLKCRLLERRRVTEFGEQMALPFGEGGESG